MNNLPESFVGADEMNMLERRAMILSKSSIIPMALRNKPSDIMVILMMAHELDIPPMQAINGINVIQGRPAVSPQLMIALIRRKIPGAVIKVLEGNLTVSCTMARSSNSTDTTQAFTAKWDMKKAEMMGLAMKDNYRKQPQTMLRWRAVSEAARQVFPDILMGLYFPEELMDGEGDVTEEGDVVDPELTRLITPEDRRALSALIKGRGFEPSQVKKICLEKFNIGDASKLNVLQYGELCKLLNEISPEEIEA